MADTNDDDDQLVVPDHVDNTVDPDPNPKRVRCAGDLATTGRARPIRRARDGREDTALVPPR